MTEKTSPKAKGPARAAPRPTAAPPAPKAIEGERIAKVLSRAGISSRREAERLIESGEVQVNGKTITSAALNVTSRDKITVSGEPVGAPEPARLWLYYKPEGLVTSASDEKGRETVFDHLPPELPRVMSVGRLDLNSEGLLLLTNDGALKRQLELPSTGWLRKYRVRVKGNPTDPELEPLRRGITVEGERFLPMEVVLDRHQGSNAWLTVGLREGKNREIRRAINAIGMIVNRLIRISYGPFRLNDMKPGEVEEVRARILRDQLGAMLSGAIEDEGPTKTRPGSKPSVRTTSRTSAADGPRPARATKTEAEPKSRTFGRSGAASDSPRRPSSSTTEAEAKPTARGRAKPASGPGTITSSRGRAALGTLSDAWVSATKPVRKPRRDDDDTAPTRARPKAAPKQSTRSGPKPEGAKPTGSRPAGKPPARRK
ncbi:MAG: pseudouridine synthase [Rhodobacteraceae bacterium]|nr:pseudouridine synthase [Paracoccaceae bacterium]MCF8515045.1 pseudouridine synthase [Paracoccaceae bacterium]MCF8519288.1 pseudouridine synthase [Paracoccaceae bacterium]